MLDLFSGPGLGLLALMVGFASLVVSIELARRVYVQTQRRLADAELRLAAAVNRQDREIAKQARAMRDFILDTEVNQFETEKVVKELSDSMEALSKKSSLRLSSDPLRFKRQNKQPA